MEFDNQLLLKLIITCYLFDFIFYIYNIFTFYCIIFSKLSTNKSRKLLVLCLMPCHRRRKIYCLGGNFKFSRYGDCVDMCGNGLMCEYVRETAKSAILHPPHLNVASARYANLNN